ncbi:MAG: PAS domain S-box protein, partial [Proteobacteria bacterium]|nr:PAS domain S-box protein [Pseudomonadota bacterium]
MKKDRYKTKEQLINEIQELRKQSTDLKGSDTQSQPVKETSFISNEQLIKMLDALDTSIVILSLSGNYLFVNKTFESHTGYKSGEIIGRSSTELGLFVNPDHLSLIRTKLSEQGHVDNLEIDIKKKSGDIAKCLLSARVIQFNGEPCILSNAFDITKHKKAEEALRESEEQYRTLIEESFDGIFVQKGPKIIFANQRLHTMLGYPYGELQGLDHWRVYHPDYQHITRERAQARMRGEQAIERYEVKLQRKDGTSFDGEIYAHAIMLGNEPGIQVWVRDITERKQAEKQLHNEKERFFTLSKNAPFGMIMIDKDGNFIYVNSKFK